MSAPTKVQLFGHSFVSRIKRFIREEPSLKYDLGLQGNPLIQFSGYPGATIDRLREKLEVVSDFSPDILIILIGTNDIYDINLTVDGIVDRLCDMVDYSLHFLQVPKVVVGQILHRCTPSVRSRYPVDREWFNDRVDTVNLLLSTTLPVRFPNKAFLWRMKGFWSKESKENNFCADGCHLSRDGQFKLLSNLRAATVAAIRSTIHL